MHEFEDLSDALFGCPLSGVAIFDTETTGFSDGDEILEIAVVDGYGETLLSSYVRPQHHTKWPGAAEVNHITYADVRDAPTIEELAPSLAEMLGSAGLVSGYNVSYDLSMLRRVGALSSWPRSTFDVMKEFARVHGKPSRKWGSKRWVRLSECAAAYGYTFRPHDAEDDARATAFCFRHLLADGSYLRIAAQERSRRLQMALGLRKATVEAAASLLEKQGPGTSAGSKAHAQENRILPAVWTGCLSALFPPLLSGRCVPSSERRRRKMGYFPARYASAKHRAGPTRSLSSWMKRNGWMSWYVSRALPIPHEKEPEACAPGSFRKGCNWRFRPYSSPKLMPRSFASWTRSDFGSTYLSLPATSASGTRTILLLTLAIMQP